MYALLDKHPSLSALAAIVAAIAVFLTLKFGVIQYPSMAPWIACASLLTASLTYWLDHSELPQSVSWFIRGFALSFTAYFLFEPFDVPMTRGLLGDQPSIQLLYRYGHYIAVGAALISWFRPTFILVAAVIVWELRRLNSEVTGFAFSGLDIENVVEVVAFVGIGVVVVSCARRLLRKKPTEAQPNPVEASYTYALAATAILFVAIGGHLGNYFYSFVAKLALNGGPLTWVLDNQTYLGVLVGIERGAFPLAASPEMTQLTYDTLRTCILPMNMATLIGQGLALFAFANRRVLISLTLVYDVFHLGVYLCFGLLFYKWMIINTIVVIVFSRMRDEDMTPLLKVCGTIAVFAGTVVFSTARLAWYDSPGLLSPFFEAHTKDGKTYRVHPAFFRSASYQASHARYYVPEGNEHFPSTLWGSYHNYKDLLSARKCEVPQRAKTNDERFGPIDRVAAYIRANHEAILKASDESGHFNYYAYPHHHVPSWGVDDPFFLVDKRQVVSYSYVLESVCLSLENGQLKRKVLARTEYPLSLSVTPSDQ